MAQTVEAAIKVKIFCDRLSSFLGGISMLYKAILFNTQFKLLFQLTA